MVPAAARLAPLLARPADAVLFRLPGRAITASRFLAAAAALATTLPDRSHALHLCRERQFFALGFAACLMRGQVAVLSSDRSEGALAALIAQFPDAYALTDAPGPDAMPSLRIGPELFDTEDATPAMPMIPAARLVALVATSGSTGTPSLHAKHWGTLVRRSQAAALRFGFTAETPALLIGTVPPQHMYGFETTILLPLHGAAESWCGPVFYPPDLSDALADALASTEAESPWLITSPLQLRAFLQSATRPGQLAGVISATSPLDAALAAAAEEKWEAPVFEIFGATELGSIASRRTVADEAWTTYPGLVLAGADPAMLLAEGETPAPLDDAVDVLDATHFRLLGRHADMVKLGGRRASLAGLNRILAEIPGVIDGAFLAPPETGGVARMRAFVVAPGCRAEDILAALRQRIDPVFLPRGITLVDRLPRSDIGKLPRAALLALAGEG